MDSLDGSNSVSIQFSIKALLTLTTIVAVGVASFIAFGPIAFGIFIVGALIATGVIAHQNEVSVPFWGCTASTLILCFLLPPVGGYAPSNEEVIISVLMFTLGGYLAYSAIRRGHWLTRLFAACIFLCYTLIFISIVSTIISR